MPKSKVEIAKQTKAHPCPKTTNRSNAPRFPFGASRVLFSIGLFLSLFLGLSLTATTAIGSETDFETSDNAPHLACLSQIQNNFTRLRTRQIEWYKARSQHLPRESKLSRLTIGSAERIALLVHGFNSSPQELKELESRLIGEGFTVLNWLVTGFATRAEVANLARIEDWQTGVDEAISALSACGTKITLIGHSLGAAIATDAVLRGREEVGRLVLLAPYFRTYYPGINLINDAAKKHTSVADWGLVGLIMKVDPRLYLPGPTPGSEDDSTVIPLQAVETALDLQKRFLLRRADSIGISPKVLAVVSWNDFVVDNRFAFEFLPERFESIDTIEYGRDEGIPHCLQSSRWNPHFDQMFSRILSLH